MTNDLFTAFFQGFTGAGLFGGASLPGAPTEFIDSRSLEEFHSTGEFEETLGQYRSHAVNGPTPLLVDRLVTQAQHLAENAAILAIAASAIWLVSSGILWFAGQKSLADSQIPGEAYQTVAVFIVAWMFFRIERRVRELERKSRQDLEDSSPGGKAASGSHGAYTAGDRPRTGRS